MGVAPLGNIIESLLHIRGRHPIPPHTPRLDWSQVAEAERMERELVEQRLIQAEEALTRLDRSLRSVLCALEFEPRFRKKKGGVEHAEDRGTRTCRQV